MTKKRTIKAWLVVNKKPKVYPFNWGLHYPAFKTKKSANKWQFQYASVGSEAKIIPVLITPLKKK